MEESKDSKTQQL